MTTSRGARLWIPVAVLAFTLVLYLPAAGFKFAIDDTAQIVWSQPHLTWHALKSYFTSDVWSYVLLVHSNYYRPIFLIWLMLNSTLFGVDTMYWHLSAILAHLIATLLFYFLARRLTADPAMAG